MLIFAAFFACLAILGSLAGVGTVGQPIGSHALNSYGWALFVNATALAAFLMFVRHRRKRQPLI